MLNDQLVLIDQLKFAQGIIEKEKEEYSKEGYIHSGKVPHEEFNSNLLPKCVKEEYLLLLMPLILNLDEANERLKETYEIWLNVRNNSPKIIGFSAYHINKIRINTVIIIHILKHFMDMMIIFLLRYIFEIDDWVKHDCIGAWEHYKNKPKELEALDKYQNFFNDINRIENANKHHLTSVLSFQIIGLNEPCFFAVNERDNGLSGIGAERLISNFNDFYKDVFQIISAHTESGEEVIE